MGDRFSIEVTVWQNGERFPLLIEKSTGLPVPGPTLYLLLERRPRGLAVNSLRAELNAIRFLLVWLEKRGIDIDARLDAGEVLTLPEVEDLTAQARIRLGEMAERVEPHPKKPPRVIPLFRLMAEPPSTASVPLDPHTIANRLRWIGGYLHWLARRRATKLNRGNPIYASLIASADENKRLIEARIPVVNGRSVLGHREGLDDAVRDRLLQVIAADSPDNPWDSLFVRTRNALFVRMLFDLGLRRGEALKIKISDIDLRTQHLTVTRSPDDPDDPRPDSPQAKTRDRKLPISTRLARQINDFISRHRRPLRAARRHEFLFVSERGDPLSASSVMKLFAALSRVPGIPNLSAHILRHDFSGRFVERAEAEGWSEDKTLHTLNEFAGWAPGSETGRVYTRKVIRKQADELSLKLQENLTRVISNDDGGVTGGSDK